MITACQVVEIVHCWEDAVRLIGEFLTNGLVEEPVAVKVKPGTGIGAFEVPRGLLFHEYTYDDKGRITAANCIIPTGQNLVNIENDMRELVPKIVDRPREEIQLMLEMLVRAYDPCISCSTHMVKVEFK
jgi:coenzyme F420-reducing hydrogenase alpha subunit